MRSLETGARHCAHCQTVKSGGTSATRVCAFLGDEGSRRCGLEVGRNAAGRTSSLICPRVRLRIPQGCLSALAQSARFLSSYCSPSRLPTKITGQGKFGGRRLQMYAAFLCGKLRSPAPRREAGGRTTSLRYRRHLSPQQSEGLRSQLLLLPAAETKSDRRFRSPEARHRSRL